MAKTKHYGVYDQDLGKRSRGHWCVHSVYKPVIVGDARWVTVAWWPYKRWKGWDQLTEVCAENFSPDLLRFLINMTDREFLSMGRVIIAH